MEYRNLGQSGLRVSRIIFGGAHIGELLSEEQTAPVVHAAWEHGINTFYTADSYNGGRAEEILGKVLKPRRDDVVLIVKVGAYVGQDGKSYDWVSNDPTGLDEAALWRRGIAPGSMGLSRKHLAKALDASLARLQTDYIDVYSPHGWDTWTPIEETLETLNDFVRAGKVRHLGCSRTNGWQFHRALGASAKAGWPRYEAMQVRFNLLERTAAQDQLAAVEEAGASILAFGSLAGGMLAGQYSRESPRPSDLGYRQKHLDVYWNDETFQLVDELAALATQAQRPIAELAQAWALAQAPVSALLVGPNTPEEVGPHVGAAVRPLTAEEAQAIDELLSGRPLSTASAWLPGPTP